MENTNVDSGGMKGGSMWIWILLIILAVGVFAYKGISKKSPTQEVAGVQTGTEVSPTQEAAPSVSVSPDVKVDETFTVEGGNYTFSQKTLKVKKGEVVKVIFKNNEGFHDFVIDELKVNSGRINAGQTAEVVFTADKTGDFVYYCSVGQHRKNGMWGTLTVE